MMAFAVNTSFLSGSNRSMKLVRACAASAVLALGALVSMPAHAQGSKIGFVNTERILRESGPAKAAQAKLDTEFKRREGEVQRLQQNAQALATKYERDRATMNDTVRLKQEREISIAQQDFERKGRELREDFAVRQNEALQGIIQSANNAIKQIAERENYDIIVQDAVTVNPAIDITEKVIQALGR